MVSAKVTLTNPQGMHMRPAQLFVNTINAEIMSLSSGKHIHTG